MKPKKKRGRPTTVEKNQAPVSPKLIAKMRRIMTEIVNYEIDERALADAFLELPSRKELPDYYDVIRRPVDIKKIRARITASKYRSVDELQEDFHTMCRNAQTYNIEGSPIYEDSITLQVIFREIREKIEAEEAEKAARGEVEEEDEGVSVADDDDTL